MKTIVICSGGLDSVALAYRVAIKYKLLGLLSFDYGQRHRKELRFAATCAARLGVSDQIIDILTIGAALSGSALTDAVAVPDDHYAETSMKVTVVPNRNAIMLAIAFGIAAAQQTEAVATTVYHGNHFIDPDTRPEFLNAFQNLTQHALNGYANIFLCTPYVFQTKADSVSDGATYQTPFAATWSCCKGGTEHCGRCGTCVERREAFEIAKVNDRTHYEEPDFWREVVTKNTAAHAS